MSADNPNVGTRKSESPIWSGGAQSDKLKVKLRQGVGTKALSSCKHLFVTDWTLLARESRNGACAATMRGAGNHTILIPTIFRYTFLYNHHRWKYISKERTSKREQGVVAKVLLSPQTKQKKENIA